MSDYATHLPVLELLIISFPIKSILELGMGTHSTNLFRACTGVKLVSVDSNDSWSKQFEPNENHSIFTGRLLDFVRDNDDQYDLAFVDGNPASERGQCVDALFHKANIIVAHDTEPESDWNYFYSQVNLPEGFIRFDYKEKCPWTSIFTDDQEVIAKLQGAFMEEQD